MASFVEILPNSGVDLKATPRPWMVVPLNDFNLILLRDADDFTLEPPETVNKGHVEVEVITSAGGKVTRHPHRALTLQSRTICKKAVGPAAALCRAMQRHGIDSQLQLALTQAKTHNAQLIAVFGVRAGTARAAATNGRTRITLDVAVKKQRVVNVSFTELSYTEQFTRKPITATVSDALADKWIAVLNAVYNDQTNIRFERREKVRFQTIDTLGIPVSTADFERLNKLGDALADWKVFIVGHLVTPMGSNDAGTDRSLPVSMVAEHGGDGDKTIINGLFGTSAKPAYTIAHEAGHFLGFKGMATGEAHWLMGHPTRGLNIPKEHVNTMNR